MLDSSQLKGYVLEEETGLPVLPPNQAWKIRTPSDRYAVNQNRYLVELVRIETEEPVKYFGITFKKGEVVTKKINSDVSDAPRGNYSVKDMVLLSAIYLLENERLEAERRKKRVADRKAYESLLGTYPEGKVPRE